MNILVRGGVVAFGAILALASDAFAAGYGTREFSALAMGGSYAGATASAGDPSFSAYNPAAISGVDDWDAAAGMIAVWPTSDASYGTARTVFGQQIGGARQQQDFVQAAYVPDLSVRYRLSAQWSLGLSISAPWGLTTIYDRTWAGRYHAHETKLLTVDAVPAIAYQPTADISLAAGLQVQYAKGRLSNAIDIGTIGAALSVSGAVPTQQDGYGAFDAENWAVGYMLGAQWAASDRLRLGVSYRSKIDHHMTGPVSFSIGSSSTGATLFGLGLLHDTDGATDLTTPAVASVGAVWQVAPKWSLAGEVSFTDWSVFRELRVQFANPAQPDEVTIFDWHDSWFGAVGVSYTPDEVCTFRAGAAFDQSPAGAARNARIPDADRFLLSAGADIALTDRTTLTLSVTHLFVPEEPINLSASAPSNVFRGDLAGVTDAEATAIGVGLTFR